MMSLELEPIGGPSAGDTTPCRMTEVTLHGVVSPGGTAQLEGTGTIAGRSTSGSASLGLHKKNYFAEM